MFIKTAQFVGLLLAFSLGFSYLDYSHSSNNDLHQFNVLSSSSSKLNQHYLLLAKQQDEVLDYMVWPKERKKTLTEAFELSKKQVLLKPFDASNWERLLYLQYEKSPNSKDFSWMLENLYKLNGWYYKSHLRLARYCVPFVFNTNLNTPKVCYQIIDSLLARKTNRNLARDVGLSSKDFEDVKKYFSGDLLNNEN